MSDERKAKSKMLIRWILKVFSGLVPEMAWLPMGTPLFHLPNRPLSRLRLDDFYPTSETFYFFLPRPPTCDLRPTASFALFPKAHGIAPIPQGIVRADVGFARTGIGSARVTQVSARVAQGSILIAQGTVPILEGWQGGTVERWQGKD